MLERNVLLRELEVLNYKENHMPDPTPVKVNASLKCVTPAFKLIPRYLKPKLLSCFNGLISTERINFILQLNQSARGTSFDHFIKKGISITKVIPEVKIAIELFEFVPI